MIIVPAMAVTTPKFTTIIVFLITFFTNPSGCLCRCPQQESEALLSMNFTSPATLYGTQWTNETDCCEWDVITCDGNSHVAEIRLRSYKGYNGIIGGVISDNLCKLLFLTYIEIWNIGTTGTLPFCLGDLHFLQSLTIDYNGLTGVVPPSIFMLKNLTLLSLRGNQLSGNLPGCLNNLSSLRRLYLSENRLSGQIPFSWGNLSFLEVLDVSFNQLSGPPPLSFAGLSSLSELCAHGNKFNESNPSWALPSSIRTLYLSLNHEITISEGFFHNLTNLGNLSLSNCTLNISTSWIPNFQLSQLELVSCQMDGQIPPWISTQFSLYSLTLANNGLVGEIPSWLWPVIASLSELNISRNHLHGLLFPNGPNSHMEILDVSHNAFIGHIPSVWSIMEIRHAYIPLQYVFTIILMFNDNLFTGNIPPSLCNSTMPIGKLNLENNRLDGRIPWCLIEDGSPVYDLNLGGNKMEGKMPQGLVVSSNIKSLVIRNNQLSGTFLPLFANDTALQVLDIGHNKFIGHLPKSIGNISSLQVLVMKDNQLSGNILSEISNLKQLQILDLSSNNLSGTIPHNIVFLRAMAVAEEDGYVLQSELEYGRGGSMNSSIGLDMTPKGTKLHYPYILSTLTSIDLSSNQLNGDIPLDFGKLKGLMFLNLSKNNLSGIIPPSLGNMSRLESLDLSSNKLLGNIPSELQSLSSLAFLNLSNNNLSGSIPQGGQMITFENTSYSRNPNLNGCPLPKNCNWPKFAPPLRVNDVEDEDNEENEEIPWYKIGLGWAFGAGFLSIVVLLISIRESWRKKYFQRVDNILKFLFPFLRTRTL